MGLFKHRGEEITVDEAPKFKEDGYTVDGNGKVVYKAASRFGKSFSGKPQDALDGAREQVDRGLDGKALYRVLWCGEDHTAWIRALDDATRAPTERATFRVDPSDFNRFNQLWDVYRRKS